MGGMMLENYRAEKQADGTFVLRQGWRAIAYRLSADEFDTYNKIANFLTLFTVVALFVAIFGFIAAEPLFGLSEYMWDNLFPFVIAVFLISMYKFLLYVFSRKLFQDKLPLDEGLPYFERRRQSALKRWKTQKALHIFLVIFAVIRLVSEP
ncbi:MAG: hypothetical protein AB3N28_10985, partial [Kordiimonas sp.]